MFVKLSLVHFVDDNQRFFAQSQSLFKHVSGLRHAAFYCVYKQQNAVYHRQDTFHFAAEIGVSRGVDNVDFRAVVVNCRVLCKYGNSAFSFDIVAVHNAFGNDLVGSKNTVLFKQLVYKRCFAVVYVGDDCNVSYVFSFHIVPDLPSCG